MPRLLFSTIHEDKFHRFLLLTVILWVTLKVFATVLLNFSVLPVGPSIRIFCFNWTLIPIWHHLNVYLCHHWRVCGCFFFLYVRMLTLLQVLFSTSSHAVLCSKSFLIYLLRCNTCCSPVAILSVGCIESLNTVLNKWDLFSNNTVYSGLNHT